MGCTPAPRTEPLHPGGWGSGGWVTSGPARARRDASSVAGSRCRLAPARHEGRGRVPPAAGQTPSSDDAFLSAAWVLMNTPTVTTPPPRPQPRHQRHHHPAGHQQPTPGPRHTHRPTPRPQDPCRHRRRRCPDRPSADHPPRRARTLDPPAPRPRPPAAPPPVDRRLRPRPRRHPADPQRDRLHLAPIAP